MMRVSWRWVLKLAFSVGILLYLFYHIPLREIGRVLLDVNLAYLLLGLLIEPVANLIAAVQQKVLTDRQGMSLSLLKIVEINFITSFYNLFLPGYIAGGVIRWHLMAQPDNKPAEAFAALVFNRLLETVLIVCLGVVFWLVASPPAPGGWLTPLALSLLGVVLVLQLLAFNERLLGRMRSYLLSLRPRLGVAAVRPKLIKALDAAARLDSLSRRAILWMTGLGVVKHLLAIVSFLLLALALDLHLSFWAAGWIHAFVLLVLLLPISFAGLGVREASMVVMLQMYGVAAASAVALSFVFLARDLLRSAFGGVLEARRSLLPGSPRRGGESGGGDVMTRGLSSRSSVGSGTAPASQGLES
jgi:uncharacterized protein (TIRG00374 family)